MKIDVYDTFAKSNNGETVHFDVFVEEGIASDKAYDYALTYLRSIGAECTYSLEQSRCNFCHTEAANEEVKKKVQSVGYYILEMEGCPTS